MDTAVPEAPDADVGTAGPSTPLVIPSEWTGAGTVRPYPPERVDARIERQATRTPHVIALRDGSSSLTYATLIARARQLAGVLQARGIGRDDLVAVCIDRSVQQIVAILGILTAGAAYVPIDPEGPADRRRFMLDDAAPRAVVTDACCSAAIPPPFSERAVLLDTIVWTDACAEVPRS